MSVQQAQACITSREFVEWRVFIEQEQTEPRVEHYYLAQVAAEVRRGWVAKPRQVKLKDFILRTDKQTKAPNAQLQQEQSKAMWLAVCKVPPPERDD